MKSMREDRTPAIDIGYSSRYTREQIIDIIDDLFAKAKHLTDVKIVFESTIDSYEDYSPGDVEVYVTGMRPATEEEIEKEKRKKEKREKEVFQYAKKLGISVCEARLLLDLKDRGLVLLK